MRRLKQSSLFIIGIDMFEVKSEIPSVINSSVQILTAAVESIASVTRLTNAFSLDALSIVVAFFTFTWWWLFTCHRNENELKKTIFFNFINLILYFFFFSLILPVVSIVLVTFSLNCFDIRKNHPMRHAREKNKRLPKEYASYMNLQWNAMQSKYWL